MLRLRFVEVAGEPRQIVGADGALSLPMIDVSREGDPRAAAEAWMRADLAQAGRSRCAGRCFNSRCSRSRPGRFFWYARYHHLVMDGYGMWLVARRAAEFYTQLALRAGWSRRHDSRAARSAA